MKFSSEDNNNLPLTKFELMLKTNHVLFFDSEEFENIIHHYLNQGKIALAKKAIKLSLDQHPSSVNLKLFKVEVMVFEDKLDEADDMLNELHLLDPNNEEIYIQKANIFSKRDDHLQAINVLKKAINLTDDAVDLYSLIGMEYLFLDEYEDAKTYFMKCIEEDQTDFSSLYNIIYCFEFLNQHEDAISYLNIFLDSNPYCEVAWHQLGKQYLVLKDYKKALAAFDFAIISDDTFVGAYLERGKVLEKLKRYQDAIESYTITLSLDDPSAFALLRIGNCYEKLKKNDLALQFYTKVTREDPSLEKGWIALTRFFYKKKDYNKALSYIKSAIHINSENATVWKLYSQINQRLKFYEEAEKGFKKTLELGNYELNTWLSRGDLLIKLGEPEAAIYNFEQAVDFYPDNAELDYRLAGLYFSLNENNKGVFHLKNGLKHNEDYAFIIEELFPEVANKILVKNILKTNL
ncbi:tetratricopeptide repeat protein [Neotamlana laminarinivorans]|uniref:Tetratricopeptide repeat protein n=1 Tax=Neotamlana laminarinivorans TaxID=2883124 RepID=A0A9X1HYX6_9FLAO|nr:tetratricopeptide repeat protein [Tamlana laminarinivorans]MCB4797508.1 tetratricopeptide repeat protein [Tamlana laminarinivorans]